jgi:triacylglycerol lipase
VPGGGYVVLLHGLGRSPLSMRYAERHLQRAGFEPLAIGYPSRRDPIEALARFVADRLPRDPARPLHFLTHSLGGIVLRVLMRTRRPPNLGRVVMLGPPNGGSQLAGRMSGLWLYRRVMGPAGQELVAGPGCVPLSLGPVDFELGVIAGRRSLDPFRLLVRGVSDGKVCLDETRVDGMADWLCVPRGHAFLMLDAKILDQAVHFLLHGRFAR